MQAIHPTTLMITRDADLSKQGDCIIAVAADKLPQTLAPSSRKR